MKKRNCKRTPEEIKQHERATKIRRMTDRQLCGYIDGIKENTVKNFLSDVKNRCKGVGQATIARLQEFAKGDGFLNDENS